MLLRVRNLLLKIQKYSSCKINTQISITKKTRSSEKLVKL